MGVGYMRWVLYLAMDLLLDRQQDLEQDHMTSAEAHIQHFSAHSLSCSLSHVSPFIVKLREAWITHFGVIHPDLFKYVTHRSYARRDSHLGESLPRLPIWWVTRLIVNLRGGVDNPFVLFTQILLDRATNVVTHDETPSAVSHSSLSCIHCQYRVIYHEVWLTNEVSQSLFSAGSE